MIAADALHHEWLRTFVAFAEHLNFTHAARALHLSQPAVHVQVNKLSEALGVPLYRRAGRQLVLTEDGRAVEAFGRDLRARTEALVGELRGQRAPRPVVLAAGEGAYLYLLGEAIRGFRAHSASPLRLLTRDRDGTVEAVASGVAHVGVTVLDAAPAGLEREVLTEVDQMVVVPAAHPIARKRTARLKDLAAARLIVPPAGRPFRAVLEGALGAAHIPWGVAVEANGWELMLHFARLGIGLAVVNGCCRVPSGLVGRSLPELPRTTYSLLYRRGLDDHREAAALRKRLLDTAGAWRTARR